MANIPTFTPLRQWMEHAIWWEVLGRWQQGIYVLSGGLTEEQASPDMTLQVDALTSAYGTTAGGNVTIDAHHDTLARIDVLYQTAAGAFAIHKGDNLAIIDPLGNYNPATRANWQQLKSPYPKDGLPAGVPMYLIYVGPAVTTITNSDIYPIAGKGISGGATKVRGEEPSGSGTALTLAHSPAANTLQLFKNGVRMKEEAGAGPLRFTRVATAVTLGNAKVTGDWFSADYEY